MLTNAKNSECCLGVVAIPTVGKGKGKGKGCSGSHLVEVKNCPYIDGPFAWVCKPCQELHLRKRNFFLGEKNTKCSFPWLANPSKHQSDEKSSSNTSQNTAPDDKPSTSQSSLLALKMHKK